MSDPKVLSVFRFLDTESPVYGFLMEMHSDTPKHMINGELAEELTKDSNNAAIVDPDNPQLTFYELSQAFFLRLMAYYWMVATHRGIGFSYGKDYLVTGYSDLLSETVRDQLSLLDRKFYELSDVKSELDMLDLKRRFLVWYYTHLRYDDHGTHFEQDSASN